MRLTYLFSQNDSSVIVGFHPDAAAEHLVEFALRHNKVSYCFNCSYASFC